MLKLTLSMIVAASFACGKSQDTPGLTNPGVPPVATVSGTVTFEGTPIAGATVTAFLTNTNTFTQVVTTDAEGHFSLANLPAGSHVPPDYHLWVNKPGYAFRPTVAGGATVTRADQTGQFLGNGVTDTGIYFTVIDYLASPGRTLSGADFDAFDGSNPLVHVARTGQQTSYVPGDDASEQAGVSWPATRFLDRGDGTVSDGLTGLVWLKTAGCFAPTVWESALADVNALASGSCGLSDGSGAGQWRLPNLNELASLLDASSSAPALPSGHPFTDVSGAVYWTSTSYFGGEAGSPYAFAVRLADGRYVNDGVLNEKAASANAVWAVRDGGLGQLALQATGQYVPFAGGDDGSLKAGVALTFPRFIDRGDGTVVDTVTGFVWLKQADCIHLSWEAAVAAVKVLESGQCGLTDGSAAGSWRMPNRNEMESLSDRALSNHTDFFDATFVYLDHSLFQSPIFANLVGSQYYWTSTTDAADPSEAWSVYSCDFGMYDVPKSSEGYTLAVRSGGLQ